MPAEVEPRVGGRVALDMGDGMEDAGTVTACEPPRRFAYEEEWEAVEGEPPGRLASEFLVEAQAGGTCVVRLVSTLHADGDELGRGARDLDDRAGRRLPAHPARCTSRTSRASVARP